MKVRVILFKMKKLMRMKTGQKKRKIGLNKKRTGRMRMNISLILRKKAKMIQILNRLKMIGVKKSKYQKMISLKMNQTLNKSLSLLALIMLNNKPQNLMKMFQK
jgi:hypothetical protein